MQTTFVPELQDTAERAVAEWTERFRQAGPAGGARGDRSRHRRHPGAGRRPRFPQSQFNRASRSRRQPGSAFKPILYAAALAQGFSPVSVLEGLHIQPQGPDEWAPRNASGRTPTS